MASNTDVGVPSAKEVNKKQSLAWYKIFNS